MKKVLSAIVTCNIALASLAVQASDEHAHGTSLGPHVHGVSELAIAIEGKALEIEMHSPAMNLVGFEHKASTQDDIAAIKRATSVLDNSQAIFGFNGGQCHLSSHSIDISGAMSGNDEHDHKADHDHESEHAHKDEHDHDNEHAHHDEHDHDSEHAHKDEHDHEHKHGHEHGNHSEITAHYRYSCDDMSSLSAITVGLFKPFPGIHKIHAVWVTKNQQGANHLTPQDNTIAIK
ncbi:uncharacterized protein DUF2796 [Sinobacterium caligoides]|uniref:Uncharacterized protein DUF2796 n=1 Tax=Sinobacterium caligoides TaxID=933926 RepID=A0A3N2DG25_9GAMM|nr:DUF2796 domain-containing protein [Sinobacterium caligoides]ROR98681.1 uncharacterized protein DUF2796 [Sinobacterium caligoides]